MSNPNDHDIRVLNGLIETTLDSADGFGEAARDADHTGHRALFEQRSFERRRLADALNQDVMAMGGRGPGEGSILHKAQRAFTDIKHALITDEAAAVGAAEANEDRLKARFEKALDDSDISATTRETIRRAYLEVAQGHGEISALKHSLQGQKDAYNRLFPQ